MLQRLRLKPLTIIVIALTMAAFMFLTAYVEVQQSKKETLQALTEEALTLIETVGHSAETTVLSNIEIENLIVNSLLKSGKMIAELELGRDLTSTQLAHFAVQHDVFHIGIYDNNGLLVQSSDEKRKGSHTLSAHLLEELSPLMQGTAELRVLGLVANPFGEGNQYLAAVARTKKPGFILMELDSRYLLDFRKRVGIGSLVQKIADNQGIVYVVLQDEEGILAASRQVSAINTIEGDPFLQQAIAADTALTHIIEFEGAEVFEVVRPFYVESSLYGIFRVALSLEAVRAFNQRTVQRFIILSLIVVVLGVIVFGFISATQSYSVLNEEYRKFQTYTGTVLDSVTDAVVAADRSGRVTVFNKGAERVLGIPAESVIGKTCSAVIEDAASCIERTLQSGNPIEYEEAEFHTKGGKTVVVGMSTSIIKDAVGNTDTVVAVLRDLTHQRKVEEQLRRQEKLSAMGELASSVAHEIRNPLNSISMTVQRFAKDFEPKEYQEEYQSLVKMMNEEVNRVSKIIQQFLQFARPPKLDPTDVEVNEFIRDVVAVVESEARTKHVSIVPDVESSGTVRMDCAQMKQVMLNLLQNAFHAIGEHGTIHIKSRLQDGSLHIAVGDTGCGIPPEQIPKIFNLYFTTKPDGTGMGLSMANQIVTEHGGRIEVESEVGKGSVFKIWMPTG